MPDKLASGCKNTKRRSRTIKQTSMKKLLIIIMMMACAFGAQAQTTVQQEDEKVVEMREKLGIDYSMPDFDTKKIAGKVIGVRLAKMLEFLQKNYTQGTYNRQLANIRYEATEDLKVRFLGVDKFKIQSVRKEGSVITVRISTFSKNEAKERLNHEFDIVFNKGVSNSDKVNALFSNIRRYIKESE